MRLAKEVWRIRKSNFLDAMWWEETTLTTKNAFEQLVSVDPVTEIMYTKKIIIS